MKILTELDVKNNINTYEGMSIDMQISLRIKNGYYIQDFAEKFVDHVSKNTLSAAMLITTYFFLKRSYLEYDRFLIGAAALFFASKLSSEHRRIDYFVINYHKMNAKIKNLIIEPILEVEEREQIKNDILKAEGAVVKAMFTEDSEIIGTDLPYKYLSDYVYGFFSEPHHLPMLKGCTTFVNDTFFTPIPLMFNPKEIALAGVILSMKHLKIQIDLIDEKKWYRTISEYSIFEDVIDIVGKITQFYSNMHKKAEDVQGPSEDGNISKEPKNDDKEEAKDPSTQS